MELLRTYRTPTLLAMLLYLTNTHDSMNTLPPLQLAQRSQAELAALHSSQRSQAELAAILTLGMGRSTGDAAALLEKSEEGMIKVLARIEEQMAAREKEVATVREGESGVAGGGITSGAKR